MEKRPVYDTQSLSGFRSKLDLLEQHAIRLLRRKAGAEDWQPFFSLSNEYLKDGTLTLKPPTLDRTTVATSCLELYLLALTINNLGTLPPEAGSADDFHKWLAQPLMQAAAFQLGGGGQDLSAYDSRCGYLIITKPDRTPCVFPGLAAALYLRWDWPQIQALFRDLDEIDQHIWGLLKDPSLHHFELAAAWLDSPARRLLRTPFLANHGPDHDAAPGEEVLLRLESVYRAAGIPSVPPANLKEWEAWKRTYDRWLRDQPPGKRLHQVTIPGFPLRRCNRQMLGERESILAIMDGLRVESRPSMRGTLIGLLLDWAVDEPLYHASRADTKAVKGSAESSLRSLRDLQEDLPIFLLRDLSPDLSGVGVQREDQGAHLDRLLLRGACALCAKDRAHGVSYRCHSVARWLAGCLDRSPYFTSNQAQLLAELQRIPAFIPKPKEELDPLHPFWLCGSDPGMTLSSFYLVAGVVRHCNRAEGTMGKLPVPLFHSLRRIACQPLHAHDLNAERVWTRQGSELDWFAPHVAPPLLARWLLTQLGHGWLANLGGNELTQMLALFHKSPKSYAWFSSAVKIDAEQVSGPARERIAECLTQMLKEWPLPVSAAAAMASGVIDLLTEDTLWRLLAQVRETPMNRRFVAISHLLTSLKRNATHGEDLWSAVVMDLLEAIEKHGFPSHEQQDAALLLARALASTSPASLATPLYRTTPLPLHGRLVQALKNPKLFRHLDGHSKMELQRMGFL